MLRLFQKVTWATAGPTASTNAAASEAIFFMLYFLWLQGGGGAFCRARPVDPSASVANLQRQRKASLRGDKSLDV